MSNNITIYYTGIGAKKSGKHTKAEFMKIMEQYNNDCSIVITEKACKSCLKKNKLEMKALNMNKYTKKIKKLIKHNSKKCKKCKSMKKKKCNFNNYIEYSGAEI